jgi:hypothetical protein
MALRRTDDRDVRRAGARLPCARGRSIIAVVERIETAQGGM